MMAKALHGGIDFSEGLCFVMAFQGQADNDALARREWRNMKWKLKNVVFPVAV